MRNEMMKRNGDLIEHEHGDDETGAAKLKEQREDK